MFEIKVSDLLNSLTSLLSEDFDTARIDVELLICHALNWRREKLYSNSDHLLSDKEQAEIQELINRRLTGVPIAYILGSQEFWSLPFKVTPATLIPRPETEHLVEQALNLISKSQQANILDLGTGSGAIALSIAKERPNSFITAVDSSLDALVVAKENARTLNISNVEFLQSNWFENVEDNNFDVIVSNPPYIAEDDPHLKEGDVIFEPNSALISGQDGLIDIKIILSQAKGYMKDDAWVLFEHGYDQAGSVQKTMSDLQYRNIRSIKDYSGHERITIAQK